MGFRVFSTAVVVCAACFCTAAAAQSALLGQAYPSGSIYLLPPDAETVTWPDTVSIIALTDNAEPRHAQLDRVLRDTHPQSREQDPSAPGPCHSGHSTDVARAFDVFDNGMPDNCTTDARVGLYHAPQGVPAGAVIGYDGPLSGPTDTSNAGQIRQLSADEQSKTDIYRTEFKRHYLEAFGVNFDPIISPIGPISTLGDAVIIAEIPTEQGNLRLSSWERISISQHIYLHFVVDVVRNGQVTETFEFSRFQGTLG